ncbi:hypothetical protein K435DRAFT_871768 [Dendrothele bispora CBS 962.96]|uniref:Uncharacterized protein n=1 Tax=Dendrothele bispora (strain CBS 962.96) TaxID=1314807 RepID=A0A4S8L3B9_DENBC|nr:hypothetical protein K435DRAFT_871768 [Dendrothele bispora CBS 962.96]
MSAPNTPSHSFPRNPDTPATPSHTSPSHSHPSYSYHVPPPNYAYYHTYPFNPQIQQYGLPPGGFSSQTMQPIQFHDMTNQITQAASTSVASVSTNKRKRNTRSRPNKNSRTGSARAAPEGTQTHQNESDPVVDSDVEPDPESSTPIVRLTGVGPINTSHEPSAFEADTHYGSLVRHPKEQNATDASDVWYFMRALKSDGPLNSLPPGEEPNWKIRPPKNEYTHLGCKLCPLTTIYGSGENGLEVDKFPVENLYANVSVSRWQGFGLRSFSYVETEVWLGDYNMNIGALFKAVLEFLRRNGDSRRVLESFAQCYVLDAIREFLSSINSCGAGGTFGRTVTVALPSQVLPLKSLPTKIQDHAIDATLRSGHSKNTLFGLAITRLHLCLRRAAGISVWIIVMLGAEPLGCDTYFSDDDPFLRRMIIKLSLVGQGA